MREDVQVAVENDRAGSCMFSVGDRPWLPSKRWLTCVFTCKGSASAIRITQGQFRAARVAVRLQPKRRVNDMCPDIPTMIPGESAIAESTRGRPDTSAKVRLGTFT